MHKRLDLSLLGLHSYLRSLTFVCSDHSPVVINSDHSPVVTTVTSHNSNSHTLFRRLIPISIFTPFSHAILTSTKSYTDFLLSHKNDLLRRCYVARFPRMLRPIPERPPDAMNHNNLDEFHASILERLDTDATP